MENTVFASETEKAWLSGIWDGEGSVSARIITKTNVGAAIQLCMTCKETVTRIIEVLDKIGVSAVGYTYQEKETYHKHAHHVRVTRSQDVVIMGEALLPYSVTKRRMWELAIEMCRIKVSRRRVMPDGRLARGGIPIHPISPREIEIAEQLRALNYRAKPGEIAKQDGEANGYLAFKEDPATQAEGRSYR